jgi:ABC-2 type transport system ATP-binding protein
VRGISFRVARGEIVGFLGPNGAGKTTTMRILAGIFPPTAGEIRIAGRDPQREPLACRRRSATSPSTRRSIPTCTSTSTSASSRA